MKNKFYFHRRIDFDILRKTPKAILIRLLGIENSMKTVKVIDFYGIDIMEPIELWVPKKWVRFDDEQEPWIWEEGLVENLKTLGEKRLTKKLEPKPELKKIPKGETIH
jgi:hypothetical protein